MIICACDIGASWAGSRKYFDTVPKPDAAFCGCAVTEALWAIANDGASREAAATQAVARPVAGTILTVADEAADAAEQAALRSPGSALEVATAAQLRAREALLRTPSQLDVLARAGVVDAGGQAFVLLLDVLVEVLGGAPAQPLGDVEPPLEQAPVAHRPAGAQGQFEVMYAVRGARPQQLRFAWAKRHLP